MRTLMRTRLLALGSLVALASSAHATDAGLAFPAGWWEFTLKLTMPGESRPTVQQAATCMSGDPITPDDLMPWLEDEGCAVKDVVVEGQQMTWRLTCNMEGQDARGKGKLLIEGNELKGRSTLHIPTQGTNLSVTTKWSGKRTRDCEPTTATGQD